jgi:hypothetical protein
MTRYYKQQSLQDVDDLFRRVTWDHRYVLAIAIEGNYFENWFRELIRCVVIQLVYAHAPLCRSPSLSYRREAADGAEARRRLGLS